MRLHLHLNNVATVGAVDFHVSEGRPFIAVTIRGGFAQMKDGGTEIKSPVKETTIYLDPPTAFALAGAMVREIPLDVAVTHCPLETTT